MDFVFGWIPRFIPLIFLLKGIYFVVKWLRHCVANFWQKSLNPLQGYKNILWIRWWRGPSGKSLLSSKMYQSITWRANKVPGGTDFAKVLLFAPTGKVAFGIGGLTLNFVFYLPVNQTSGPLQKSKRSVLKRARYSSPDIGNDTLNTMHCKLINIQLIIIDDISMVGSKCLDIRIPRHRQIFISQDIIKSIIVFGDLKQLISVGDRWIFLKYATNPYNSLPEKTIGII